MQTSSMSTWQCLTCLVLFKSNTCVYYKLSSSVICNMQHHVTADVILMIRLCCLPILATPRTKNIAGFDLVWTMDLGNGMYKHGTRCIIYNALVEPRSTIFVSILTVELRWCNYNSKQIAMPTMRRCRLLIEILMSNNTAWSSIILSLTTSRTYHLSILFFVFHFSFLFLCVPNHDNSSSIEATTTCLTLSHTCLQECSYPVCHQQISFCDNFEDYLSCILGCNRFVFHYYSHILSTLCGV